MDPRLKQMALDRTEEAIAVIIECLHDEDKKIALKAAEILLDRGHGKAAQSMTVSGDPDAPLVTRIERAIVDPKHPDA